MKKLERKKTKTAIRPTLNNYENYEKKKKRKKKDDNSRNGD